MEDLTPAKINLSIKNVLKESWSLINGIKLRIIGYMFLAYIIAVAMLVVVALIDPATSKSMEEGAKTNALSLSSVILSLIVSTILWFFLCNALFVGAHKALGKKETLPPFKMLFKVSTPLLIISFIYAAVTTAIITLAGTVPKEQLGVHLLANLVLIFASFILNIIASYAAILIALYQVPFTKALYASILGLFSNFSKVFLCSLLMQCLIFISILPLGIGLFWTLPMLWVLVSVLFRETFPGFKNNSVISGDTTHIVA